MGVGESCRSRGVSSIELGLILLLIAVAAFLGVAFFGEALGDEYDQVPGAFDGEVQDVDEDDGGAPGDDSGGGGGNNPNPAPDCDEEPNQADCDESEFSTTTVATEP